MFHILLSLFGIAIVYRNLSLLEKFEVIGRKKMFLCFLFLQIPLFLFVFFKEQITFTLLFIGIFLLTLIFYRRILKKLAYVTYEKCHLRLLDHLILLLKSGKSGQVGVKIAFASLSGWEKIVFQEFAAIFELYDQEKFAAFDVNRFYFDDLKMILKSNHQIIEQLQSLREGLRLRYNLRHKSRQVTQQIRAQALVALFIFALFLFISFSNFNLKDHTEYLVVSITLFLAGFFLIFKLGGRIRWKT